MSGTCADTPKAAASAMARARLPAAISDFEGTQPVLRHSPPILPFSTSTTGTPKAAAAAATERPPEPAPMTQRSGVRTSGMRCPCPEWAAADGGSCRAAGGFEPLDRDGEESEQAESHQAGHELRRQRRLEVE